MSHRLGFNCHLSKGSLVGLKPQSMLPLTFWQLIIGAKDHLIKRYLDNTTMKTKSKKQDDEGSTQSNASRYDFSSISSGFYITFAVFDCLSCQAWLITCMFDCHTLLLKVHPCHEWPCHCLIATPWFSYRFFDSHLTVGPVWTLHVWSWLQGERGIYLLDNSDQWFVTYIWCLIVAKYYDLVWQIAAALHHFANLLI